MTTRRLFSLHRQQGHTLLATIVLLTLSLLSAAALLKLVGSISRSALATKRRSTNYVQSEAALHEVMSWLRDNSQALLNPFRQEEFYTHFERTSPSVGTNDSSALQIPTKVKLRGTTTSAILVTNNALGTGAFPSTFDITTLVSFPALTNFAGYGFGAGQVRLTLVDAIAEDPTLDFGNPPSAAPQTDFRPLYRIDAMSSTTTGAHMRSYLVSDTVNLFDIGFYGQDYLEFRQPCDSYISETGPYTSGSKRAKCSVGSNSTSQVHKSETIYGSLRTNGAINEESPFGGAVCGNFAASCPSAREKCSGEDCAVPLLEQFQNWSSYCPTNQGNLTISGTVALNVTGTLPNQKCWDYVTVNTNSALRLTNTNFPYYIDTLELSNNSNSVLDIAPSPSNGVVELYVNRIVGDKLNGNQTLNGSGKPSQFRLYYLGANTLTLNGNANMNAAMVAPKARIAISGTFDYFGSLLAKELTLNGSGSVHYDESLGGSGKVSDIQYRIKEIGQFYR